MWLFSTTSILIFAWFEQVFKPLVKPIFDCFNLLLGRDDTTEDDDDRRGGGDDTIVNDDACEVFSEKVRDEGDWSPLVKDGQKWRN